MRKQPVSKSTANKPARIKLKLATPGRASPTSLAFLLGIYCSFPALVRPMEWSDETEPGGLAGAFVAAPLKKLLVKVADKVNPGVLAELHHQLDNLVRLLDQYGGVGRAPHELISVCQDLDSLVQDGVRAMIDATRALPEEATLAVAEMPAIMVTPSEGGDLGLILTNEKHEVRRVGYPSVSLGGKVVLWKILEKLVRRGTRYCPIADLRKDVWMDSVVEEGAIWSAVHDLRDLIKPLHVRIKHTKGLGYRLEAKSD